jgi:hypothetical protein
MADDSTRENDPFEKVLDVAKAALEAREQAIIAKEKADRIEELAQEAMIEANQLRDLASNLACTAVSVAGVALGATGVNCRDAYNMRAKTYNKKISLHNFLDVIQTGQTVNNSSSSNFSSHDECGLKQWQSNETVLKTSTPPRHRNSLLSDYDESDSDTRVPSVRLTPYKHLHQEHMDYGQDLSPSHSWTRPMRDHSRENLEKFPLPGAVNEHRDILAASFESTSNIKPLWEDRYVQPETTGSTQKLDVLSWQERKAMKQFQYKLAKAEHDGEKVSLTIGLFVPVPLAHCPV